jgi:hypothetical protein
MHYGGNGLLRSGETNRGAPSIFDKRLCFQAHDNYFECIESQNTKTPNKFLCIDQLYSYEAYCTTDFIYRRKQRYEINKQDKEIWTQNQLNLINTKKNFSFLSK